MAATIPEKFAAMLHKKVFVYLATIMPDGSPQVTPIWIDYDGRNLLFNSAKGRVKDKNIRRDPRVTISVSDPENPYSYFEVRGRVTAMTEDAGNANIDKMAQKYLGQAKYPWAKAGETRVIYTVEPQHVSSMG